MVKAAFNEKRGSCYQQNELRTEELVKCDIWSIALYGAETWTSQTDQKHLESSEMW
jgi:hypothetical protein